MFFLTRTLLFLFLFFALFALQAARAFSFFGVQPNLFFICFTAFTLLVPRTGSGFFSLIFLQAAFLFLLFFFFPFFVLEVALFFLLLLILFWARPLFSGFFGFDLFASLFLLFPYFVFLGFRALSFPFFFRSSVHFFVTFGAAFALWFVYAYGKKRISF